MTTDYFEAKKTGGSKDSIEITIEVKSDKVVDFANEIASEVKDATVDRVLEIIDRYYLWNLDEKGNYVTVGDEIKAAVLALKGGEQ